MKETFEIGSHQVKTARLMIAGAVLLAGNTPGVFVLLFDCSYLISLHFPLGLGSGVGLAMPA